MSRSWLLAAALLLLSPAARSQQPASPGPSPSGVPAVEPAAPVTSATDPAAASAGYDLRLRQLRERVDDLKGRVFDSKTRLMLLREQILQNLIAEARAEVVHVNETSSALTLEEAVYFVDNEKVYYQSNRDGSLDRKEFSVYTGSVAPGNHLLTVEMVFRGNGKVFTYMSGYVFRVKSSFPFFATKGREVKIRAVAYEKGGAAARLEERPSIRFEMHQVKAVEGTAPSPGGGPAGVPAGGGR